MATQPQPEKGAALRELQGTRARIFADLDQIRKKYGAATLPAFRRYLTEYTERTKRQKEIAKLSRELDELKQGKIPQRGGYR